MGFLNEDEMLDALSDTSWQIEEPPGEHPVRFCQANKPDKYQDDHEPHEWWSPEFVRTRVFRNKVERTLEVAWYWCEGIKPKVEL